MSRSPAQRGRPQSRSRERGQGDKESKESKASGRAATPEAKEGDGAGAPTYLQVIGGAARVTVRVLLDDEQARALRHANAAGTTDGEARWLAGIGRRCQVDATLDSPTGGATFGDGRRAHLLVLQSAQIQRLLAAMSFLIGQLARASLTLSAAPAATSLLDWRVLVPEACVGAVIGHGGSNVRCLRETTGCDVTLIHRRPGQLSAYAHLRGRAAALDLALARLFVSLFQADYIRAS